MLKGLAVAVLLFAKFSDGAEIIPAVCAPAPEISWVLFLDQARGFCFWYPASYKTNTDTNVKLFAREGRRMIATLVSSERRTALSDDRERADVTLYYFYEAFDLQKLIRDAPTGYITPPTLQRYGSNVFYYYGRGGGGVAYPDQFYSNLHGHALQLVFDGPYPSDSNSPTARMKEIERRILLSFRAEPRRIF